MINQLTTLTHTRNSAETLPALLASTQWAHERIVVDMMSADDTCAIARDAGCRVVETPVADAVDSIRNDFLDLVSTDWTLVLDSDEYLSADAEENIQTIIRQYGKSANAIALPRFNSIAGHIMRGSQWYPDQQTRLFKTGTVKWQHGHHRSPVVDGGEEKTVTLTATDNLHIHHRNYESLREVLEKQLHYAVTDKYEMDPANFDFGSYIEQAYSEYNRRFDPESDGQLSQALAVIMAWDRIVRGIIHWEKLGREPELGQTFSLPLATVPEQLDDIPKRNSKQKSGKRKSGLLQKLRGKSKRLKK